MSEPLPGAPVGPLVPRRRLHLAAAVAHAARGLRDAVVPALAGLVLGGSGGGVGRGLAIALAIFVLGVVGGVVRWRRSHYEVGPSGLRYVTGVLSPDESLVPLARIAAVDTTQGPVQRLFDVVALRVQVPGGGREAEVELTALTRARAAELRAALGHPEPPAPAAVLRLAPGELLLAALTAPQFGVLVPIASAVGAVLQDRVRQVVDVVGGEAGDVQAVVLVVLAALVAAWVVSFLGGLVAFAGFALERHEGERPGSAYLLVRRGLLQRNAATVVVRRIDAVAVVEGVLRAPLGRAALRVEVAATRGEATAARTLVPLVRTADVPALLAELVPDLAGSLEVEERPPARALTGYVGPRALLGLVVGLVPAVVLGGAAWVLPVLAAALGAAHGAWAWRAAGLARTADRLVVRRRRLARTTLVARPRRLQAVTVRASPLQRRRGLATLEVELGTGRDGVVGGLDARAAREAYASLAPTG